MRTNLFSRLFKNFFRVVGQLIVYIITLGWIRQIIQLIIENIRVKKRGKHLRHFRRGRPVKCNVRCATIRPDVYKRADPLIYSQRYLMEQGLAVTWNNPDIQLYKDGLPVSSNELEADTTYSVVATIYNNSTEAPAVGMPVEFHFRSFGIGTTDTFIGTTSVNLPVKGAPAHPAQANMLWHTPQEEGHYCLQVDLKWTDDANPKNNVGQENTNVGHFSSPAIFDFPVRNEDTIRKLIHLVADVYTIPVPIDCREKPKKDQSERRYAEKKKMNVFIPPLEEAADWTYARVRHGNEAFPIPAGWTVDISPRQMSLGPGEQTMVKVTIIPPVDFQGQKTFNINALHGTALLGGVTLFVSS